MCLATQHSRTSILGLFERIGSGRARTPLNSPKRLPAVCRVTHASPMLRDMGC
jgi:hypothetical protein